MSLQRVILISGNSHITGYIDKDGNISSKPPPVPSQGVNVVLGGTMMAGMIVMVFLICYCCHRSQQKRQSNLPQYWRDPGLTMEVYTVEGQQIFDIPEEFQRPTHQGPPPSYESVVTPDCDVKVDLQNALNGHSNDVELPTYEDAIKLAGTEERNVRGLP